MPWFERKFRLDLPLSVFPLIVERLRGTPARLEEQLRPLPDHVRLRRVDGSWSIQENAGHLLELEALWWGRLEDVLAGKKTLREADLTNRTTDEGHYNTRPVEEILARFREKRGLYVARLEGLEEAEVPLTALHPRLLQPMRVLDMAYFAAEHDDHHLARITELRKFQSPCR